VADNLLDSFSRSQDSYTFCDLKGLWRNVKNEMMKGQTWDLESRALSTDEIIEKYRLKSGALYGFAASAPATILGLTEVASSLKTFGNYLGIAYQLADDLHDFLDSSFQLGKDVGKDANKDTIPNVRGSLEAVALRDSYKNRAIAELTKHANLEDLVPLVEAICL